MNFKQFLTDNSKVVLATAVALTTGLWAGAVLSAVIPGVPERAAVVAEAKAGAEPIRAANAPRASAVRKAGMAFVNARIDSSGSAPRACLEFTQPLATNQDINFRDFLVIDPDVQVQVEASGTLLCLGGLPYEPDRQVTIRRGLPSSTGQRTARDETFTLSFGDRPAFVGFVGAGVILPRSEADGLAIETVNVSEMKVSVVRVNDRILSQHAIQTGEVNEEGGYGGYWMRHVGDDVGTVVYEGELDVANARARRNQAITTVFPLGAVLRDRRPGAYIVRLVDSSESAGANAENDERPAAAYRWVLYTDIALQTFKGASGLDVVARSLRDAQPMRGATLTLIAQNNEELGRATTDRNGHARFSKALLDGEGPEHPRYVMAYANGDFAALDLQGGALDLSDRGVEGRTPPGDIDAYVYTERGIYRPGETVRLIGLIRDIAGRAISNRQSTLVVYRPNGTEARRLRLNNAVLSGALAQNIAIDRSAPRGVWRADLLVDGQEAAAGRVSWSVEDFVPQRLRVEINANETPLLAGQSRPVDVQADFLYGAPGAGLKVEAEARLQVDPTPFPNFRLYQFGRVEESFEERFIQLPSTVTDGDGRAQVLIGLSEPPTTSLPLRARVTASVADPGGRVVREGFAIPVRLSQHYLGIRQRFDNGAVPEGATARFDLIAVDAQGRQTSLSGASWTLVREDWHYDWYLENGRWRWRRTGRDVPVNTGNVSLEAGRPVQVAASGLEEWGSYRLIVRTASGAETSSRFYAGWGGGGDADTPDMVTVAGPTQPVRAGARAQIQIRPPYAGEAQIVIATDRVLSMRTERVEASGTTVTIPVEESWGGGAYVLVTVMTPRDPANLPVPRRAVGVTYVPVNVDARTLEVQVGEGLGSVRPRTRADIPIVVTGAPRGERVRVAVAAVDEGILQITKYVSPNPDDYYFGRRALGVMVRDDYGRLLNPNLGAPAVPRQGGDSIGGEGLTVVPTRTVSLFSDVITLDGRGRATIPLDIPDFNGRLRLMAVAWSDTALGHDEEGVVVRDPVVAELTLPRFLAPGDEALATLTLDNVEGPAGAYHVSFAGSGAAALATPAQRHQIARNQRIMTRIPVSAAGAGLGRVTLTLRGPSGFTPITRSYDIQSRSSYLPVTLVDTQPQAPTQTYRPSPDVFAAFASREGSAVISYSSLAGLDPAPILAQLERYPYGCTEQLVSTSMPLLYFNALANVAGRNQDPRLRARVQNSVTRLLDRQAPDGAFGLWVSGDAHATPWLGAFATDFVRRAKDLGYVVPQQALDNSYQAMRRVARLDDFANVSYDFSVYRWPGSNDSEALLKSRSAAYALYVLAKAGRADIGQVRYFHDARLRDEPSPLARAHIGAALAHMGDRARARNAFRQAESAIGYENTGDWYQTPYRDLVGVIALASEAGETEAVSRLRARLSRIEKDPTSMMTQEQAHTLLALHALMRAAGPIHISLNGQADAGRRVSADAARIVQGLLFRNDGQGTVWRTLTTTGPPRAAPPAASAGYALDKRIFRLDGTIADLEAVRQGERVIVVVSGSPAGARTHPSVLVDLLPAGLEIESILGPQDTLTGTNEDGTPRRGPFAWVGEVTGYANVTEARDDRFVAAADIKGVSFRFAYVARAVTPGNFTLPAAQVEDMYRPGVFARTGVGRIRIAPSGG